ncbi:ribonuclease III [Candidatus Wolfebacteria bacterium]|nr:ribonuclease III [Candidatus Wolfebacteria bacterium]
MDLSQLEQKIGIVFNNKNLLKEALTHRSYLNENPKWSVEFLSPHNERLEFLGDAVLELISTEILFNKFPKSKEGDLTSIRAALVNYQMLAGVAKEIGLDEFILLSRGEAKDIGKAREVILANAFEAFLGAIYLDAGYEVSKRFIESAVMNHLDEVIEKKLYKDPKSLLQEIAQEKFKITPTYSVLEEKGPDHAKIFKIGVYFSQNLIAEGEGLSKQEGEVEAAKNALHSLQH